MSIEERADHMHPVVEADRHALNEVEHLVTGYYHSLDLTLSEIQVKVGDWADGLTAAKAGSVELTLATVSVMTTETALRDRVILELNEHLFKFPR